MSGTVVFLEPKGTILEVIRAAKKRGFRVVALSSDRLLLDSAPAPYSSAVPLIDEILMVSGWNDLSEIRDACASLHSRNPIVGVYAGMDPCAKALAELRSEYGLPSPRVEQVDSVLNKFVLRRKLREAGLSDLRSYHQNEATTWTSWVPEKAVYFKPIHGFFSAYVRRCSSLSEFRAAENAWSAGSASDPEYVRRYLRTTNEYHLEEAFDGELLSVEAISSAGNFTVLGLLSRILYSKDAVVEMGSCFPYPHPFSSEIIAKVKKAHEVLGLTDGPTHTEVIVDAKGHVEIIDLNPRFVGADVLQSINNAYGIAIEELILNFALGMPISFQPKDRKFSCLQYFMPPEVSVLRNIRFPETPEVRFKTSFIASGTSIKNTNRQLDYLGCYLTVMPSFDAAVDRSRELRTQVLINDTHQGGF